MSLVELVMAKCEGCGTELEDYGPLGLSCPNAKCSYEWDQAMIWLKQRRREEELKELARLKEKYEVKD